MGDYKCDECHSEGKALRIDPNTNQAEILCGKCLKLYNADGPDNGIYISVRLIEFIQNTGGTGMVVGSVDDLVAGIIGKKEDKKPVTTH
jgi:hypothetical protein